MEFNSGFKGLKEFGGYVINAWFSAATVPADGL